MFSQPEVPVQVNVQVDNQYLDKHLKEYVEQYCKTFYNLNGTQCRIWKNHSTQTGVDYAKHC